MKDVVEVFHSRISNPFYGFFVFSFISVNWQALFYLLISSEDVTTRIKYFSNNSDWISLFLIPIIIGIISTILFPWINYVFLKCRKMPTDWRNKLQASSEHELLKEKQKYATERAEVERANLEVEQIKQEVEQTKQQTEEIKLSNQNRDSTSRNSEYKRLIALARDLREEGNQASVDNENEFYDKAKEMEKLALEELSNEEYKSTTF